MPDVSFFHLRFDDPAFVLVAYALGALFVLALAFAGVAVVLRRANDRALARRRRLRRGWKAFLPKVLASEATPAAFRARVGRADRSLFMSFLCRYARRLKGSDLRTLQQVAGPWILVGTASLKHGSPEARAQRIQIVGRLGFRARGEEVAAALDDPSPFVAMAALRSLARHGGADHLPALLDALPRFTAWSTRSLAALLAKAGPPAVPVLRRAFAASERPLRVRLVAAEALRLLEDLDAAEAAVRVAGEEAEPSAVREAALRLLARVGQPAHLPAVRALASGEAVGEGVRTRALEVLSRLGEDADASRFEAALHDDSAWIALSAAEGLRRLGRLGPLRDLAASDHPRASLAQQALTERALITA